MTLRVEHYINSVVGKPWVNRAEGPDAFDCFGLVLDSFRKLDGIELPTVPGYSDFGVDIAEATEEQKKLSHWDFVRPADGHVIDGSVIVCYQSERPVHVGRCLVGGVLHCLGNKERSGLVRFHTHNMIHRLFPKIEYYAFNPTP